MVCPIPQGDHNQRTTAQFAASSVVETACRSTYQSGNEVMIAGSVHADRLYLKTHTTALTLVRSNALNRN